ncbi:MAG TPA: SPOR domain-containing protein [Longimicrobiales bacterium]|nr:SPOR domain-containing protein [Longimicrobiales bacterium]
MHDTKRGLMLRSVLGLALGVLLAAPAGAQDHRTAITVGGGWSQPGDITPGMATSTTLEAGWLAGLQFESWTGSGRIGLRLGGSYLPSDLEEDPNSRYRVYSGDLSLLVRLLPAGRGRWVAPYIALGGGGSVYRARDGSAPIGGVFGDEPVIRAVALAGGGLDLLPSRHIGVRLEAVDRIVLPSIGEGPDLEGMPMVHGPQLLAALQLRGRRISTPAPVVLAAAPRPTQAAPQAPARVVASAPSDADARALRERLDEWDRRIGVLTQRVDSLERAVGDVRLAAADDRAALARLAAQPAGRPVGQPVRQPAGQPVATPAASFGARLFTVQVGAFVEEPTANRWAQQLARRGLPVWVTPATVKGQRYTRVRIGALPSLAEAEGLARVLRQDYGWPVWVDRVGDPARLPDDAVSATRWFLRSN